MVVGWNDTTATVSSVRDSKGNVYTRAVGPTTLSGFLSQSVYYAKNIVAAAARSNTVTVTFSGAAVYPDIRALEYSGADPNNPVDVTAAGSGTSTSSSSGSATTTTATDLIFGADTVTTTSGIGSGFTKRILTIPDGDVVEDKMVTTTGSYSATAPVSQPASGLCRWSPCEPQVVSPFQLRPPHSPFCRAIRGLLRLPQPSAAASIMRLV